MRLANLFSKTFRDGFAGQMTNGGRRVEDREEMQMDLEVNSGLSGEQRMKSGNSQMDSGSNGNSQIRGKFWFVITK
jgi:hypothetical protein